MAKLSLGAASVNGLVPRRHFVLSPPPQAKIHTEREDTMSELMSDFERLRSTHLDAIHACIDRTADEEAPEGSSLVEMLRYHMSTGGKRLRALLPLAVAEAFEQPPEALVPFGAACEMLHNATLVHDDLQDGDRVRRGEETVWVRYGSERAINLGDAMLYWTLLLVDRLDCSVQRRARISRKVLGEALRVIDGQEREFLLKQRAEPSADDYFRMVEGKTSGLFALPVVGAAEFCGAPEDVTDELEVAAGHLGVLFQIQDDVLDLYADKGREHRGTDICEGKISALVVHFLAHAPASEAAWMRELLETPREAIAVDQIDRAADAFRQRGSLDFALTEIDRRRRLACDTKYFGDYPAVERLLAGMAELFLQPIEGVV
jgi:geranylgeranyl diphosphate synthase, type I